MKADQKHITLRILSALIVVTLLIPSGIKLLHVFEHDAHHSCEKIDTANFHECEVDCAFLKYNLQHHYLKDYNYNINFCVTNNFEIIHSAYGFFPSHRVLSFSLRGPPSLV